MNAIVHTPALQSHLNAQVSLMTEMTNKIYDAMQRLTECNLRYAQQFIQDSMNASRHLLSAGDPVEFSTAAMASAMPASEHLRGYQQNLMGVLTGTQVELTRTAGQHMPETSRTASAVADEVVRRSTEATERLANEHRQAMERMSGQGRPDGQSGQQGQSMQSQGMQGQGLQGMQGQGMQGSQNMQGGSSGSGQPRGGQPQGRAHG